MNEGANPTDAGEVAPLCGSRLGALWEGMLLPVQALGLLWRLQGVKRWALLPVLVNVAVYGLVIGLALWWLGRWHWGLGGQPWQFWGGFGGWLFGLANGVMDWVKWMVAVPVLFIFCYFSFTAVGMIVASPFHDLLSEQIERGICQPQDRPQLSWRDQARFTLRSVWDSLRIVLRQMVAMALTLPFLLIPGVGFLPLFLVTAYYTGRGFVDVPMVRNSLRNRHKRPMVRLRRWHLLGMGLAMEWMFLVPFLGLLFLPLGVVAGTVLHCRCNWRQVFRPAGPPPPPGFVFPRIRPGILS